MSKKEELPWLSLAELDAIEKRWSGCVGTALGDVIMLLVRELRRMRRWITEHTERGKGGEGNESGALG